MQGKQSESLFWADQLARKIVREKGEKDFYTCAAGITPSGTIHIGNFREIITVEIVARALKHMGKKVRFIYSWDDYDRLRRVPGNIPEPEKFAKHALKPIRAIPDPWGCHKSWAEHFEKEVENLMPGLGIKPEYIKQYDMYRKCAYAEQIKQALEKTKEIKTILDKYRKEPLAGDWMPVRIYCEKCGYEDTRATGWDGKYELLYSCRCGHQGTLDFRKSGNVKLPWRVDWPMRWHYEKVDFEPAGKEHSTPGGSRTVGMEIQKGVWKTEPPVYQMYDYIILEEGGKMSSSKGNVIKIKDVLDIYLPEVMRFLFTGTKPVKEFAIFLGEGVFKVYDDFYRTERVYFGKEQATDKMKNQHTRIYELSCPGKPPKEMPVQPAFKHAVELVNMHRGADQALRKLMSESKLSPQDMERYRAILSRAGKWLEKWAPERWKFEVRDAVHSATRNVLAEEEKNALRDLGDRLEKDTWDEESLFNEFYKICGRAGITNREFFKAVYLALIGKEQGPRLAPFILAIGKNRVAKLLKSV